MKFDSSHIDNLIAKYIAGEISPAEEKELLQWIEFSPENKKYFGDIQFVDEKTIASHKIQKVNVDSAWIKLHAQMRNSQQKDVNFPKIAPLYKTLWFKVAASILLLAGLFIVFYKQITPVDVPQVVQIISKDSIISKSIEKNTKVVLNKNSKLVYSRIPGKKQIEVELTGEAFIDVNSPKDSSFIVKAGETLIQDIGTIFNIKAYPADNTIEVYVKSGEVRFYSNEQAGLVLKTSETGIYHKDSKVFEKMEIDNLNAISYKTKIFVFRNTKLSEVINALNAVYPEVILIENSTLSDYKITVTFDNESIGAIAEIIGETLGLRVEQTENGFVLKVKKVLNN